jgi:tetratricopeptide (TPR) repeat protein
MGEKSRTRPVWPVIAFVLVAATVASQREVRGLFITPETQQVPVARLVANLEKRLAAEPGNAELHINLARLHGMAYALKTEEVPVGRFRPEDKDMPYLGPEPNLIPYRARPASSAESAKRAEEHLAAATDHYREALEIAPENLLARLGYAWTLDHSGKAQEAVAEYRRVIAQAWLKEQKATRANLGDRFYTEEAAGYLIPLLDPEKDAHEIANLREQRQKLRALPRPITPIAIPLTERLAMEDLADWSARIRFDADGSGLRRPWTWISRDAGWLVYDAAGAGAITSALQWFGNVTFWLFWHDGYDALAALDDDGDGELTGRELDRLAIWRDGNQNGRSERGEVRTLAAHGIIAVSCRAIRGDRVRFAAISPAGVRFKDGRTRPTYDVILYPSEHSMLTDLGGTEGLRYGRSQTGCGNRESCVAQGFSPASARGGHPPHTLR